MHPMMPVDLDQPEQREASERSGWGGLIALLIVVAILVVATIALDGPGEPAPAGPVPTEAPPAPSE